LGVVLAAVGGGRAKYQFGWHYANLIGYLFIGLVR
jgi:hypothetical protein